MALPLYGGGTLGGAPQRKKQPWEDIMPSEEAKPAPTTAGFNAYQGVMSPLLGSGPTIPNSGPGPAPTFPGMPQPGGPIKPPTLPGMPSPIERPIQPIRPPTPSPEVSFQRPEQPMVLAQRSMAPVEGSINAPAISGTNPAAAAAGAARNASASSAAAGRMGQQAEQANAGAVAAASNQAARGASAVPAPPQAQGLNSYIQDPLSRPGQLYEDYVTKGLETGRFGEVDAARGAYDRDSALRSTMASESAKQQALRAGATPGSALFNSIMASAMSGANRSNMEQGNQVNALNRDVIQRALDRAAGIETQTYNRADAARAFEVGREDLAYERSRAEQAVAKGDQNAFLNSIEDTAVRSWAASQFAQGKTLQEVSAGIWTVNPDTGRTEYRKEIASLSPGKQNAANILDYLTSLGLPPEKVEELKLKMAEGVIEPFTTPNTAKDAETALQKFRVQGLQALTEEEKNAIKASGRLPTVTVAELGPKYNYRQVMNSENGGLVVIGNKLARIIEIEGGLGVEVDGKKYLVGGGKWYEYGNPGGPVADPTK